MKRFAVAFEMGPKRRVFAQVLSWIGWCRSGKDEATALNELVTTGTRYGQVAARAVLPFVAPTSLDEFEVVERIPGTTTTDFGAPSVLLTADQAHLEDGDIERLVRLIAACWATFDDALHAFPSSLLDVKPERGRSPSAMRLHLLEADRMHLSAFGPAFQRPDPTHLDEQEVAVREQILAHLRDIPSKEALAPLRRYGFSWTPHFAVRRSAWHALDHAWELLDRLSV